MKITTDEWLDALAALDKPKPIPEGWVTTKQMQSRWGIARVTAANRLNKLVASGKAQVKRWKIGHHNANIYRLKR